MAGPTRTPCGTLHDEEPIGGRLFSSMDTATKDDRRSYEAMKFKKPACLDRSLAMVVCHSLLHSVVGRNGDSADRSKYDQGVLLYDDMAHSDFEGPQRSLVWQVWQIWQVWFSVLG